MAKPDYIQFHPGEIYDELAARSKASGESLNLTARRDLVRYYDLLARERRTLGLNDNELLAIMDACNGVLWEPWSVDLVWAQVAEAEELAEKWGIDLPMLVGRLRRLTPGQKLALVDATERFWAGAEPGESHLDGLRRVGLLIGEP